MKIENKLEGATNFRAWKAKIDIILAKNDPLGIAKGKVTKPSNSEGKRRYDKDNIKDHLIPYVSSLQS